MKQNPLTKLALILLLSLLPILYLLLPPIAFAQEPTYEQVNEISKKLSCPTCAGLNLADCRTQTCEQWRGQVGDLIREGYSEEEILDYFSDRYGNQVLQEPPKSGFTLALWVLPVIILLAGGFWLTYTLRGWTRQPPAPDTRVASPADPSQQPSPSPDVADDYLSQVDKDLDIN